MKSAIPFMGVRVPVMRKASRDVFNRCPPADRCEWQDTILAIWRNATYREERYAAVEFAVHRPFLHWMNMESLPILDELITDGAWWDYVDRIAPAGLGHILSTDPKPMRAAMRRWAGDENIWRRRSAVLCQLGSRERTDLPLLFDCIDACMGHPEFFVRKAMGWALRDYARTNPGEVLRYVAANESRLSDLTRKEALKHLT